MPFSIASIFSSLANSSLNHRRHNPPPLIKAKGYHKFGTTALEQRKVLYFTSGIYLSTQLVKQDAVPATSTARPISTIPAPKKPAA